MSREKSGNHGVFERFFHSEVAGSLVLLACALTALVWANSPWADSYFELIYTYVGISWGDAVFKLSLQHWINDALMVLFFFIVGLEVKREVMVGQLSSVRQAALPVAAAIGGMVVPAALYFAVNAGGYGASGWGVPMATDIAFALGILAIFGSRAPLGLKVFLTALAIADDIGAVLVIALFYTDEIRLGALIVAGGLMLAIVVAGRAGVRSAGVYIFLAIGVWAAVFTSGLHATVAGILVAMLVPVRARIEPVKFLATMKEGLARLAGQELTNVSMISDTDQLDELDDLYHSTKKMIPVGIRLEHLLHPVQASFVLPLFALFNAGVALGGDAVGRLVEPIGMGIVLGLVLGKPVGVLLMSWLAVRLGWADLPDGVNWRMITGVGFLAGIGFTMALFITDLAFKDAAAIDAAKIGILFASFAAGVIGYLILRTALPQRAPE